MIDEPKILEMKQEIEGLRGLWRVPLFMVGAGVSAEKVPTMNKILEMLACLLGEKGIDNLACEAKRIANDVFYQSRAVASKLFGNLQEEEKYESIWDDFTRRLLAEGRIWQLDPTPLHEDIAEEVINESAPAICVSLNYDGLMAKAISSMALLGGKEKAHDRIESFYPCRILTSSEEIQGYLSRDSSAFDFYPVIKLRGDIFHAVCENEGCRFFRQRTPLYEISPSEESIQKAAPVGTEGKTQLSFNMQSSDDHQIHDETKDYGEAISCPGCPEARKIELDFPGARIKELEAGRIIEALIRYVVPTLSCVVVLGLSGRWDPEIVEFLRVCAIEREIRIYYLNRSDILMSQCSWATGNNFTYVKADFSQWKRGTL